MGPRGGVLDRLPERGRRVGEAADAQVAKQEALFRADPPEHDLRRHRHASGYRTAPSETYSVRAPASTSAVQSARVHDIGEAGCRHEVRRERTTPPGPAIDEVGTLPIELGDPRPEVSRLDRDVHRARDVPSRVLVRVADVDDDPRIEHPDGFGCRDGADANHGGHRGRSLGSRAATAQDEQEHPRQGQDVGSRRPRHASHGATLAEVSPGRPVTAAVETASMLHNFPYRKCWRRPAGQRSTATGPSHRPRRRRWKSVRELASMDISLAISQSALKAARKPSIEYVAKMSRREARSRRTMG